MTVGGAGSFDPAPLIHAITYKQGWRFRIGGPLNNFLCIQATTPDSRNSGERTTQHMFELPAVDTPTEFVRWVFDRLLLCELHEAGEFFKVGDDRPFYPHHQDEGSPYVLVDRHGGHL